MLTPCQIKATPIFNKSMKLLVNGKEVQAKEGISLLELLKEINIEVRPVGLAVAVNEEVIPKSRYGEVFLKEGDRVEIVNIVGGG